MLTEERCTEEKMFSKEHFLNDLHNTSFLPNVVIHITDLNPSLSRQYYSHRKTYPKINLILINLSLSLSTLDKFLGKTAKNIMLEIRKHDMFHKMSEYKISHKLSSIDSMSFLVLVVLVIAR